MKFFTKRAFIFTNLGTFAMYFGMFGAIFFLSQYLQLVLGNSALDAGLKLQQARQLHSGRDCTIDSVPISVDQLIRFRRIPNEVA